MQIRHMEALIAVADTGSLRSAAQQLKISQPALTKTLRDLEQMVGVPLLQRTVRGSVPTDFGHILLVRARSIVEEIRRAKEELSQVAGIAGGSVTIGISVGASLLFAADAISRFMRDHPQVRVRVIHGLFEQLVGGVRQGRFDLAVGGINSTTGDHVKAETLFHDTIVTAVRKGHPLAKAETFAELGGCGWALTNDEPGYVTYLSDHFAKLNLRPPQIMLRCESFLAILDLIPQTDLVVAMPQALLNLPIVAERLDPLKLRDPCPATAYTLLTKAGLPLTPLAESLAHHIRKSSSRLGAPGGQSRLSQSAIGAGGQTPAAGGVE